MIDKYMIKFGIHNRDLHSNSIPAELEEGSWLVEGRLALSDGWLGSSISPCETTGSMDTSALGLEQTGQNTTSMGSDQII